MDKEIFTSVIRVKDSAKYNVVSVKSSEPVEYDKWIELSKIISTIYVSLPIKSGDVLCRNIANTGIDIIATKNLSKN